MQIFNHWNWTGGRGHWAVYHTGPQSFFLNFSYSMPQQLWELYLILIGWLIKLYVQSFQLLILLSYIHGRIGRAFIYCQLSYPCIPDLWRSHISVELKLGIYFNLVGTGTGIALLNIKKNYGYFLTSKNYLILSRRRHWT